MKLFRINAVAVKEFTDGFRDRRAIYTLLFSAVFGPLMIAFLLNQIAGQEKSAHEIKIPVVGREYAPVLMNWLEQQPGVELVAGPKDPEQAVRDRTVEFALVVDKEFAKKFGDSRPAKVQLYADSTRTTGRAAQRRLKSLLQRFSAEIGGLRLAARGISPAVAGVMMVDEVEVSSARQRAAMIFNIIPMFLLLASFSGGMQIGTDSTAGERERGSLEPLLLNPVPRWELVAGKWLAAAAGAMLSMVLTLVITSNVLLRLPLEDLGIRFQMGTPEMLQLMAALGPMALLSPAFVIYLACFAKSYKEAQSYMGFAISFVTIPTVLSTFYPMTDRPWMHPIPILGQYSLSLDVLGGHPVSPLGLALAGTSALLCVAILLRLATSKLSDEKVVFGR
jgi:sodium transport system permease protein